MNQNIDAGLIPACASGDWLREAGTIKETEMSARIDFAKVASGVVHAMLGLERYLQGCEIGYQAARPGQDARLPDQRLRLLPRHALERCAHRRRNRAAALPARRLARGPCYTERERAALAWTEALTAITEGHASDEVYAEARERFSEKELADLSLAIVAINGWNRLSVGFRPEVGGYQPAVRK